MSRVTDLVPSRILRAIDRVSERRFLATTGPANVEYVRRLGLEVRHGPFAGMRYLDGLERSSGDLVAKLVGTYERELHGVISEWIAAGYPNIIDVGCAEGFYAVGFAVAMAQTTVHAYDIDAVARERCTALAQLNGAGERVLVRGACEQSALNAFPADGVALLSDCEGYELVLLDPELAPALRGWPILVELHEFIDASVTDTIRSRFQGSHELELIDGDGRDEDRPTELEFMTERQRAAVLGERRPGAMRWAYLRPRSA